VATVAVGPGRQRLAELAAWLVRECAALGVLVETGTEVTVDDLDAARAGGVEVVLATGSRGRPLRLPMDGSCAVVDPVALLTAGIDSLGDGPVIVHDPVGGPIGIGVAEWLAGAGLTVALVTPDQIAGTLLSLTGDLAEANSRLQRAGVHRYLRSLLRGTKDGHALLEDRWTGVGQAVPCASIIDCGPRLPEESLYRARPGTLRAGDCVAPRGILEAVLEGRRLALALGDGATTVASRTPVGADR
jgi:2,4-dienoyl-CoA reductase (NADPH2)